MNSTTPSSSVVDPASMAAGRQPRQQTSSSSSFSFPPLPRADRDGFELISREPIVWDVDLTTRFHFQDILYHHSTKDHCARLCFNRPQILNAFRPRTIRELQIALEDATDDPAIAVILLTSTVDATQYTPAFCAGGDQTVRKGRNPKQQQKQQEQQQTGGGGYYDDSERQPKLRVLDLQIQMRRCPKPIMAVVRGYAIGGGHILHMVCDLTIASQELAVFGQTGPRMGSFDAGYGSVHAAALMGQKKARELWFLSKFYTAQQAVEMGLINAAYPDHELDGWVAQWTRRMAMNSPTALAACKAACNAAQDGAAGLSQMGGELTRLFYLSDEAEEGRQAFFEKRAPNFRSKL